MALIEQEMLIMLMEEKGPRCGITVSNICNFKEFVWMAPTIGAAPVVHGNWKTIGTYTGGGDPVWGCTKCGYMYGASLRPPKFAFCPSCGAWMDGGKDDG